MKPTLKLTMMQRSYSLEAGPSWQMISSLGQEPSEPFSRGVRIDVRSPLSEYNKETSSIEDERKI